jgi:hypothetical protein
MDLVPSFFTKPAHARGARICGWRITDFTDFTDQVGGCDTSSRITDFTDFGVGRLVRF